MLAGASWRAAVLAGAAVCISRVALAACCARGVPAARADGLGSSFAGTVPRGAVAGVWAVAAVSLAALGGWAGLPWWQGGVAVVAAGTVVAGLLRRAVTRLGGVTGDVLGAATEVALAALLVVLA
jgi:adenosylcobinamide-GDP ribazoletransferase